MQALMIEEENFDLFEDLIPDFYEEALKSKKVIGFGMFDDFHEMEVVGVVLVKKTYGWLELVWYALSPEYRGSDYADEMLMTVFRWAKESDEMTGMFADLEEDFAASSAAEVFQRMGFSFQTVPAGVYRVTVDGLKENAFFKYLDEKIKHHCIPLSGLSKEHREQLSEQMDSSELVIPMPEHPDYESYDGELSQIHLSEKAKPDGAIFVKALEDYYCISCLWSEGTERALLEMISAAFIESKKLDGNKEVMIPVVNSDMEKLIRKIAPSAQAVMKTSVQHSFAENESRGYVLLEAE